MLLRREMLVDVGAFDPAFFTYYEDTDLSWRMRLRGWRVIYEPLAVVEHVHSGTSVEWSPLFTFHVDRNRLFMILKNAPPGFVLRTFTWYGWLAASGPGRAFLRRKGRPGSSSQRPKMKPWARARVHVRVLASLVRHLPMMLSRRRSIRRRRVVNDTDIARWFHPRRDWDAR